MNCVNGVTKGRAKCCIACERTGRYDDVRPCFSFLFMFFSSFFPFLFSSLPLSFPFFFIILAWRRDTRKRETGESTRGGRGGVPSAPSVSRAKRAWRAREMRGGRGRSRFSGMPSGLKKGRRVPPPFLFFFLLLLLVLVLRSPRNGDSLSLSRRGPGIARRRGRAENQARGFDLLPSRDSPSPSPVIELLAKNDKEEKANVKSG